MGRFLFVVPPLAGHINPTVSLARELTGRGHGCAWVGHAQALARLLPEGAARFGLDEPARHDVQVVSEHARGLRGAAALKFLFEDFLVPLGRAMRPGTEDAIDRFAPDVLVVDQQALAGGLAARRRGLPWASLATTSASLVDPFAGLPKVRDWLHALLAGLEAEAGLAPSPHRELSPHLVVAFSTEALVGPLGAFPAHYRFVGPSISDRPEPVDFPWETLADGRKVLVTLGTVNAEGGARFFGEVVEALGGLALQAVLVAPEGLVPRVPANVLVRPRIPQLALLPHMDAVVCHAGHNTVVESLAHGLPLVVAPIKDDQPIVADQVVGAGAGVRVKYGRVRAPELRRAVVRVLEEPSFRQAARRVQASFEAAGGAARAADAVEELL